MKPHFFLQICICICTTLWSLVCHGIYTLDLSDVATLISEFSRLVTVFLPNVPLWSSTAAAALEPLGFPYLTAAFAPLPYLLITPS